MLTTTGLLWKILENSVSFSRSDASARIRRIIGPPHPRLLHTRCAGWRLHLSPSSLARTPISIPSARAAVWHCACSERALPRRGFPDHALIDFVPDRSLALALHRR